MQGNQPESVSIEALVADAIGEHKAGRLARAEELYRRVLAVQPGHPEASHNSGVIAVQRGEVEAGIAHFRMAVQSDPERELYWLSHARALFIAGRAAEASEVLLKLGDALIEQGRTAEAIQAFEKALAANPCLADAHFHLGSVLSENGQVAQGFAHFMRRAQLEYGGKRFAPGATPQLPHKLKHDREQREYLERLNLLDSAADQNAFHLGDGSRIRGPAVNPAKATASLIETWRCSSPQMVVIDDFLTPEALDKLRAYCAESTIWRRVYDAGYIGATPPDGFACPLLAQITEEVSAVYSAIVARHEFHYLGAFKYDSALSTGTNTHADFSAVNVNLYLTPDDANLEPGSGGMILWDLAAKDEEEMRRYNSDEAALHRHLQMSRARCSHVPHRANRAVVFKSCYFHKTDECHFKEGYLNKRINVSLLFGRLGAATRPA